MPTRAELEALLIELKENLEDLLEEDEISPDELRDLINEIESELGGEALVELVNDTDPDED